MAGEWKNRIGNAAATPVRAVVGAPAHALVDLSKTATGYYKNVQDISMDTLNEIQETISDAGKKGKWYHKLFNIPVAGVGSVAKVFTGGLQATVNPIVNGVFDFAKTGWGFLKNEFNTVKSVFSKNPMSDFSFEKLKLTPTWKSRWHPKNLLIGGAAATAAVAATPASESTPIVSGKETSVTPEEQKRLDNLDMKFAESDRKYQLQQEKSAEEISTNRVIKDMQRQIEITDQNNQELQKTMLAMKDQMEQQNKLMQQQLKQKDDMIAALQANNTRQIAEEGIADQVEEKLDSEKESPKKKSLKKKQHA